MALQNRIITILGRKGTGKTTAAITIARDLDRVVFFDPRRQVPQGEGLVFHSSQDTLEYLLANFNGRFRVIFQPPDESEADRFMAAIRGFYDITIVFDEVDTLSRPAVSWGDPIEHVYRYGRHNEIDLIATARRPAEISKTITQATDLFILFHTAEPADLDYIRRSLGPEVADRVQELRGYEHLEFSFDRGLTKPGEL